MLPVYMDHDFLSGDEKIFHGFYGRKGGVSSGIYESLNCGPGSEDKRRKVIENRRRVAAKAGVGLDNLLSLDQVHSNLCLIIDEPFPIHMRPEADAMVTAKKGVALTILTADCAPVLLKGEGGGGKVIGAAHAGWRGAFQGILEESVEKMLELGAERDTLRASIGPCIAPSSYEVSKAFADPFITQDPHNGHFFRESHKPEHLYFDLPGYCSKRLAGAGVGRVSITGLDTYSKKEEYFSYRRASHQGHEDYGRNISVIAIMDN